MQTPDESSALHPNPEPTHNSPTSSSSKTVTTRTANDKTTSASGPSPLHPAITDRASGATTVPAAAADIVRSPRVTVTPSDSLSAIPATQHGWGSRPNNLFLNSQPDRWLTGNSNQGHGPSSTRAREHNTKAVSPLGPGPHIDRPTSQIPPRPGPPVKRPSGHGRGEQVMERSPLKKARTGASPPRKVDIPPVPTGGLTAASARAHREGAHSPLFFSHSASKQISRPLAFPTTDVAATMLSRMREDPAGTVTTLKLPRASLSSASPARSGSTPGSWASSSDSMVQSASSDVRSLPPGQFPPGLQVLQGVGVLELVEQDQRPTFLVDLANPANSSRPGLHILYYNTSLRTSHDFLQLLSVEQDDSTTATEFGRFKSWLLGSATTPESGDPPAPSHTYGGVVWTCSTLRRRFRFISGEATIVRRDSTTPQAAIAGQDLSVDEETGELLPSGPTTPVAEVADPPDYFGEASAKDSRGRATLDAIGEAMDEDPDRHHPDEFTNQVLQSLPVWSTFDWTKIPLTEALPEHIRFARSVDWAATPLGPVEEWSSDLRTMSNMVMGSPHPAAMYWGPQFVCLYNAAYIELAGQKHPALMGSRYEDAWAEIWDEIKPVFLGAWESGQATMKNENQLHIYRKGFLEEAYFSWSIVPLVGGDGDVVGLYNPAFEHTRRRVNERRMLTLREIGERTATATTVAGFWPQVQKGLEYNDLDVPFALIYSVNSPGNDTESDISSLHSGSISNPPQIVIEGSLGAPDKYVTAMSSMDLKTSDEGFAPYLRQSLSMGGAPIVLSEEAGTLPQHLVQGLQWRGYGDPCKTLVVFPVIPTTTGETVAGFIIMGVNPRRPYDDDYKLFIHLLARQLATSMASVVLFEEEIKRGQRAARLAALDRQELSMQLVLRTQEATESEFRFTRMAEAAPVGMFIADSHGFINYCNDMWWTISRHSRSDGNENGWMNSVRTEDRPALDAAWTRLLEQKVTISVEFRFNHSQKSGDNTIDTWVLMSAYPEKSPDGNLTSIFGCITDISPQKWAEKFQNERREEAVELKRQQENFIDITSHEMRNPLSAILQCADQIANSITGFATRKDKEELENVLEGCLDAANTINLCASHQKRIVDDILTLSKLDSNLLAVTPVDEQPVRVVQRALKMFESELVAHDIEFEFLVDNSFEAYGVKWVKMDPSRLRQVLINLMTNAIKFTQGREKRNITVRLSASKDISEVTRKGTVYFDRNEHHNRAATMDINNAEEWGMGELINLHCSVEDTGPGLAEEELKILFQRFQQATPRTHVQYGGSGLGLFISRILTEMQGGQIGVSSHRGVGSKFSFYIKSRACVNPPADYEHISPFKIARKATIPVLDPQPQLSRQPSMAGPVKPDGNPLFDVLIVEDNIVNQKVLQRQLRSCGNNTFVANHGKEALQTLEKSRFWAGQEKEGVDISVILMDLEMPVMDGMTCARRIRELEREGTIVKHIPIIAVTAYARPEQIENAKAAGIDDVISKPFRIPELLPKIEELVTKYKDLSLSTEA
ncbi:Hybrid signal transduction histidine kinase K [Paramyrothecium foliicola]|nr:Hybrid signal transduction histidine kinase K [Paramyrothecium foliicola]